MSVSQVNYGFSIRGFRVKVKVRLADVTLAANVTSRFRSGVGTVDETFTDRSQHLASSHLILSVSRRKVCVCACMYSGAV